MVGSELGGTWEQGWWGRGLGELVKGEEMG